MNGKKAQWLYIGSLVFVLVGLGFVSILQKVSSSSDNTDVRARASSKSSFHFTALVTSVDESANMVVVNNLRFSDAESSQKDLGEWKVTVPANTRLSDFPSGTSVTIAVDPPTFLAATRSMNATEFRKK
jgi:hypothetical protein